MAPPIQKFREIIFQLLYSRAFEKSDFEMIVPLLMREHAISRKTAQQAIDRALKIWELKGELDQFIAENAIDFELDRIGRVERALLQQGIYEIRYTDLPPKVAITEAMRLAKKFSTNESVSFVNAILDKIYGPIRTIQGSE